MSTQPWIEHAELLGEKVLLRPVTTADKDAAFALIHGREAITDWLVWDGPESPEDLKSYYGVWPQRSEREPGCDYQFAVVDRADGQFSGSIALRYVGHVFWGEVGYWLAEEKWGRGLMTEAVGLILWLAFEHTAAVLVHAECFAGNEGSRIVLERNGFELEPAGDRVVEKKGRSIPAHFHVISRSAWEGRGRRSGAPLDFQVTPGG